MSDRENQRAAVWRNDFGQSGGGYAQLVKDLPKHDPMRTRFARLLKEIRSAGGTVRKADMGGTYAVFGGRTIEDGIWFRWNPERLRIVDMLEEAIHWQQIKKRLPVRGYTTDALEIMAKRAVLLNFPLEPGLRFELNADICRIRSGTYLPAYLRQPENED